MEKTVKIGDTEVTITETDDGFKVAGAEADSLAEYVRENVRMATHEEVRTMGEGGGQVNIVDTDNYIISNRTLQDIVDDESIRLSRVKVEDGALNVVIRSHEF